MKSSNRSGLSSGSSIVRSVLSLHSERKAALKNADCSHRRSSWTWKAVLEGPMNNATVAVPPNLMVVNNHFLKYGYDLNHTCACMNQTKT